MKLTDIDLNDRTEVAAAHALLAAVLGVPELTIQPATGKVLTDADAAADLAGIPRGTRVSEPSPTPGQLPADAQPMQDAAAVFGAAPLSLAPSFAAAETLPNALGGLPGSLPGLPGITTGAPLTAPTAHALASPAASPTNLAPNVELDSRGLPWDSRIHASTKSKKKDGSWTAQRGLNDDAKVSQIEAELRATVQGQSAAPLTQMPAPSTGAMLPGIAASADPVTFEQLMPRVTQATIAGVLPPTALQQVCGTLGLQSVVALQTNPAFVPHAWAQLKAAYPALQ